VFRKSIRHAQPKNDGPERNESKDRCRDGRDGSIDQFEQDVAQAESQHRRVASDRVLNRPSPTPPPPHEGDDCSREDYDTHEDDSESLRYLSRSGRNVAIATRIASPPSRRGSSRGPERTLPCLGRARYRPFRGRHCWRKACRRWL